MTNVGGTGEILKTGEIVVKSFQVVQWFSSQAKGYQNIPEGILFSARYLLLMNNRIDFIQLGLLKEYLSPDFWLLKNKQLSDGAIKEAEEGLQRLMCLHMGDSKLRSIPADLPTALAVSHILPLALKELYLAASKISVILTDVFSELSELGKLDLSHNRIAEKGIMKAAFGSTVKLENLNLAEDLLTGVPQNLPSSPKELRLDKSRMFLVRQEAFLKLENLTRIDL
ncbi:keratocan-like [Alca torda]